MHPSESAAAAAIPVRLLSSVAVVGRDNEPIYLRGDLCDCATSVSSPSSSSAAAQHHGADGSGAPAEVTEDERSKGGEEEDVEDDENSSPRSGRKGLLGRIKGAVSKKSINSDEVDHHDDNIDDTEADEDEDQDAVNTASDEDDDPFGFFSTNNNNNCINPENTANNNNNNNNVPATSLTQQLVLHASLDRFEEMACRSNKGGAVRWRTPGSTNSANAMWMGLLCQVEERWNVYGYLTNTGIKFMILVENVYLNEDGTKRRDEDHQCCAPPILFNNNNDGSNDSGGGRSSSSSSLATGSREGDLKKMFARLHELYVRYTMNPFSKLRSPIQSRVFDEGIVRMAQSFNGPALEQALASYSEKGGYHNNNIGGGGSDNGGNGLVWM